jgi:hypothetical protein
MCNWQYVEVASTTPVSYVYIRSGGNFWNPFFIDNIVAATGTCPNPPCEFERAQHARNDEPVPVADMKAQKTSLALPTNITAIAAPMSMPRTTWGQLKLIYR